MSPFANPLALLTAGLVALLAIAALLLRLPARRAADRWGGRANLRALGQLPSSEADLIRRACLWGALLLTTVAFARPQWGEVAETVQKMGLDVVVLLDTSRSMGAKDTAPTRLERAKLEIRSLLAATEGDRTALVDFAGVPVSLSPLTEDSGAIGMLLDISDPDLVPAMGTDIGKAIVDAIKLLPQPHDRDQVILLISDGEDQGKDAVAAARTATRFGIRIFAVGVGTAAGTEVPGPNGRPMVDPQTGSEARTRLDEAMLRQLASITDGRYWALAGAGSVVPAIVEELGRLKRKEYAARSQAMRQDQFALFLIPALLLLLAAFLLPERKWLPRQAAKKGARSSLKAAALLASLLLLPALSARAQNARSLAADAQAEYAGGRVESALALYQRALRANASPALAPVLHYNAGTCLLASKRPQEARDELTLALAGAAPLVKERALYNLAKAFYGTGDLERALSTLRSLLVESPGNRDAASLYEWILRQKPPDQPPPKTPPNPPPQPPPPDVLEQLPMPPPKELQNQMRPPETPPLGMKPW